VGDESLFVHERKPLKFMSQWLFPNSRDILQIYTWETLEAVDLIVAQDWPSKPAASMDLVSCDANYEHFQAAPAWLEYAKESRYLGCSLVEAIQRSEQWKQEERMRADNAMDKSHPTSCLTISIPLGGKHFHDVCIVYAVLQLPA
jgi:hypothetical protein